MRVVGVGVVVAMVAIAMSQAAKGDYSGAALTVIGGWAAVAILWAVAWAVGRVRRK